MTSPTPQIPSVVDGVLVDADDLNGYAATLTNLYNTLMAGFRTSKPTCATRVTNTGRSVANNTDVLIIWDVQDEDTDNMFSPGGTVITCRTAGLYRVGVSCSLVEIGTGAPASATQQLRMTLNSTTPTTAIASNSGALANLNGSGCTCSVLVRLVPNDVLRCYVRHNSGNTTSIDPENGGTRAFAHWVAP